MTAPISIIILTHNEELNLPAALDSVQGWARAVFVVDSFSTDDTVRIARSRGCAVVQHGFVNFGLQRNHALEALPITTEWVFFLDADEQFTPALREEISLLLASAPKENGFFVNRRMIWMGRWIRRGYYPSWILRLFRNGKARCESRPVNEHLIVDGPVGYLTQDLIHEDRRPLEHWMNKHIHYAREEAKELLRSDAGGDRVNGSLLKGQVERNRLLRQVFWNRLPPLVRPAIYFAYRFVLRGGFLDGPIAYGYHFLQAFWYPTLIDILYLRMRRDAARQVERDSPEAPRRRTRSSRR